MNSEPYNIDTLFENRIFLTIFIISISIFTAFIVPRLPNNILKLFNSDFNKFCFMTFILWVATKNIGIALVCSVLLVVLIQNLTRQNNQQKIMDKISEKINITSDNQIKLINNLITSNKIDDQYKEQLIKKILKSDASDKHKFDSCLYMMRSCPKLKTKMINKLYNGQIKSENLVNMTKRLIAKKYKDKYLYKIVSSILKSSIDADIKKTIIILILNSHISKKYKKIIMKQIMKSKISKQEKSAIISEIDLDIIKTKLDSLVINKNLIIENNNIRNQNPDTENINYNI